MFVQSKQITMETNTPKKKTPFEKQGQTRGPLLENIIIDIARHYKTTPTLIRDNTMNGVHAVCRKMYCYIAWKITNATLREIGAVIDKHHSTVIHHKNKVSYWIRMGNHEFIDQWLEYLQGTQLWGQYEQIR